MLLVLSILIVSCKKDKIEQQPEVITQPNPTNHENSITEISNSDPQVLSSIDFIGEREVRNVIDAKEVFRKLIRESFTQLFLNSHFNPNMPPIETRVACVNCTEPDCGCPAQMDVAGAGTAHVLTLKYFTDDASCSACTLAPSGLNVSGELIIDFSADFSTAGHVIKLLPQANFQVDEFDIDGGEIEISETGSSGLNTTYDIVAVRNISVTNTLTNETTVADGIGNKSKIIINDVNNNHGMPANAFGLLDDKFKLVIENLMITCSNTEQVFANSVEDDATGEFDTLFYDMDCEMIQDGSIQLNKIETIFIPPFGPTIDRPGDLVATYDYGASAAGDPDGTCDDIINVTIPSSN